jgi:hypothetical protein
MCRANTGRLNCWWKVRRRRNLEARKRGGNRSRRGENLPLTGGYTLCARVVRIPMENTLSQKIQTVAEAIEQLLPTQTCSLVAPDKDDAKGVTEWYQQVTDAVKAGKFRILNSRRDTASHTMVFAVIVEKL